MAVDHNPKEVLTLEETAKWLGVKPETVRQQAKAGFLPGRKIGRAWRFSRAALLEWLKGEDPLDADDLEAIREGLEAIRRGDVVPLDELEPDTAP